MQITRIPFLIVILRPVLRARVYWTPLVHLVTHSGIVQRDTNCAPVVAVVLSYDTLGTQLPQPSVVVRTARHQIRAVGAEGAIPDPPLMTVESGLEREGGGVAFSG